MPRQYIFNIYHLSTPAQVVEPEARDYTSTSAFLYLLQLPKIPSILLSQVGRPRQKFHGSEYPEARKKKEQ